MENLVVNLVNIRVKDENETEMKTETLTISIGYCITRRE